MLPRRFPLTLPLLLSLLLTCAALAAPAGALAADSKTSASAARSTGATKSLIRRRAAARRHAARVCAARRPSCKSARRRARALDRTLKRRRRVAPRISKRNKSVRWTPVADVETYVVATTVADEPTQYDVVEGTTLNPEPVPGETVDYSVRTDVPSSEWGEEVTVTYPATETTTTAPAPVAQPEQGFEAGLVSGSDGPNQAKAMAGLKPAIVRVEFDIDDPASALRDTIAAQAANGTRVLVLAGFHATMPTVDHARNLASWAAAYGPGGTFWQGRSDGHLAVRQIEFGNETNMGWQYGDNWDKPSYSARAREYALRLKDAHEAIQAVNPAVGLLAQGDDANTGSSNWVDNMFAAVPDLASRVVGWTTHPYGLEKSWSPRLDRMKSQLGVYGAANIPVWVTEWGLATDNGRCLSNNYGWDPCMTFETAGAALTATVAAMRAKLGNRLRAFLLYQATDQRATGLSTDREHYFGALRNDSSDKGAYTTAVRQLLAR